MEWSVFLAISAACLLGAVVLALLGTKAKYKSGRLLDPSRILFAGVVISAVVLYVPIYLNTFKSTDCGIFETVLLSVHNMIKLFVVDGEFELIMSNLTDVPPNIFRGYTVLSAILLVAAPVLTFGFVLSFFKNISAYKRYVTHYNYDTFIFSELNERSLCLAKSLKENGGKSRFFVFTDVFEREEEESYELLERAKELGAVCFKKDIVTIDFSFHSKKRELNLFAIGEDQSENISQALKIVSKMKNRENSNLYVFSTQAEAEMLLSGAFGGSEDDIKIKVRRVNEVQSLISRNLFEHGYNKIFEGAYDDGSGVRKIGALVVGMGEHGTEMTKALPWFCQMDGYLARIDSVDLDPLAEEKFTSLCPELMEFSGKLDIEGEAKYTINIHSGVDVDTVSFDKLVESLPRITYVFVSLGSDEKNISTALRLRCMFEKAGYHPEIQAVVSSSDKKEALMGITNFKGQSYDIDFIGDMKVSYSEEVILGSDVEEEALKRHLKWGKESDFWKYDYNYKSSVASAIHRRMKELCGVPGITKEPSERTEEELLNLRILEHRRWNAYVRSDGYVFSGSIDRSTRNDLAKTHNCLVPFDMLPLSEQEKDDD